MLDMWIRHLQRRITLPLCFVVFVFVFKYPEVPWTMRYPRNLMGAIIVLKSVFAEIVY